MVHSLTNELLAMDAEAETRYAKRVAERNSIIQQAQEEAIRLAQQAIHERDTSRAEAISVQDREMHLAKDRAIAKAHDEATAITTHAKERQGAAVEHILATVRGQR